MKWFSSLEPRAERPWVNTWGVEGPGGAALMESFWGPFIPFALKHKWLFLPALSSSCAIWKVFRQQLVENVGAWVWEVERAVVSSAPSVWKVLPSFKAEVILFHFHSWTKTDLLSGSFLFNDFHEKAFIQALTWLSEYTFQCESA